MMTDRSSRAPGADRFLLGIVVGSVALILVGIAAVFFLDRPRSAQAVDPISPAGVVQAYVEAIRAGDRDRAYDLLSRAARADLRRDTYRERFPSYSSTSDPGTRVVIEPVSETGDTAEVKVTISRFATRSDPFSAGTYHRDVTVRLVREDGAWRISQPAEPYHFTY
ncbi:MAG: ARC6/PARC6 family protein [Chloroflexota bacterium]|nr:ARC6/PARC6 family protein [Chloroflexota bacterium]